MTGVPSWCLSSLLVPLALLGGVARGADPCPSATGLRQSPIDLDMCADTQRAIRQPLRFTDFDAIPYSMTLTNTGALVTGDIQWAVGRYQLPQVSGGHLPGRFVPQGISLHWGANSTSGSEHSVNGRRYAAELHIRCRNILYPTNEEALQRVDGLAGVIVFFEYEDVRIFKKRGLGMLAPSLASIKNASTSVVLQIPPSMKQLMPKNLNRFVTYEGSVTAVPPCPEVVTWTALLTPVSVVATELQLLRALLDAQSQPLESSQHRPQRPLNGRQLYTKGVLPICV